MVFQLQLKRTNLMEIICYPFLFAAGDWCLAAPFRGAAKIKNPNNPVNPV
jgi:hypothetical protein